MGINVTFKDFNELIATRSMTGSIEGRSNYVAKTPKGIKVELKTGSGVYVIGYGSKPALIDLMVDRVTSSGFELIKRPNAYAVLAYKDLESFIKLVDLVDSVASDGVAKTKRVPAKKLMKEVGIHAASNALISKALKKDKTLAVPKVVKVPAPKSDKSPDEIERIRAANLAKMKEITERNKLAREKYGPKGISQNADAPFDPMDFTPESARAELELDSFSSPEKLTVSQAKTLI